MWLRLLFALCVSAPGGPTAADSEHVTTESVQTRLADLDKSVTLSDEAKDDARDFYQRALAELEALAKETERAEQFSETARRAPEDLGRIRRDLALLPLQPQFELPENLSLEQLQQRLAEREAAIEQFQLELENLNNEPQRRAARRSEISKQRAAARKELDDIQRQIAADPDPEQPAELAQARRTFLVAKAAALEKLLTSGTNELDAYQATIDLLPLRRDLAAAELALVQREAAILQSEIKRRRASEVNEHLRQAEARLREVPESLEPLARLNLQLVQRRREVRDQQELITWFGPEEEKGTEEDEAGVPA